MNSVVRGRCLDSASPGILNKGTTTRVTIVTKHSPAYQHRSDAVNTHFHRHRQNPVIIDIRDLV